MFEPKISIIIPVYNVEKYLAECLDSCINQTLEEIEIICVDDCSPDNSIKILEEYQQKDSRIKIIRHEKNRNLGGARNTGLENATGEYIWFVDSDDYIDTKACQILYDAIKDFDVDLLCFSAIQFSETDKNRTFSYPQYFQGVQINKVYHPKINWREINFSNLNVTAWAYLAKKSIIQNFKFRENIVFEDTDFTLILFSSVDSFCYIPYTAYFHRINAESITKTELTYKKMKDAVAGLKTIDEFIKKRKIPRNHFCYNFFIGLIGTALQIYGYGLWEQSEEMQTLLILKKKYCRKRFSLLRFVGKILKHLRV